MNSSEESEVSQDGNKNINLGRDDVGSHRGGGGGGGGGGAGGTGGGEKIGGAGEAIVQPLEALHRLKDRLQLEFVEDNAFISVVKGVNLKPWKLRQLGCTAEEITALSGLLDLPVSFPGKKSMAERVRRKHGLKPSAPSATPSGISSEPQSRADELRPDASSRASSPDNLTKKHAVFVSHITIPPSEVTQKGEKVVKVWRIKNEASTPWPASTALVPTKPRAAAAFHCPAFTPVPGGCAPNEEKNIELPLTIPQEAGYYELWFRLAHRLPDGSIGTKFGKRLGVQVIVQ